MDKKGESDDDDDDAAEDKNDFLGRGDEGDELLLQSQPASQPEDVGGEGEGEEDHGRFVHFPVFHIFFFSPRTHLLFICLLWYRTHSTIGNKKEEKAIKRKQQKQ